MDLGLESLQGLTSLLGLFYMTLRERFWAKVDIRGENECWPWKAAFRSADKPYGVFWLDGKNVCSPRIAWELTNGPIPKGEGYHGTLIRHKCDNPPCCNPVHLEPGTMADNQNDMRLRGRAFFNTGESNGQSVLKPSQVMCIRKLKGTATYSQIGKLFRVTGAAIQSVMSGRTWSHLQ